MCISAKNSAAMKGDDLYTPKKAKIVQSHMLTSKEKYFELRFEDGSPLGHSPGQFVEVSVFGIGECPISISSSPTKKDSFELVIRQAGNVTAALHSKKAGDSIAIRGPYGRGFDTEILKGRDVLFIGGGIGIVPLRSLINYVIDRREEFNGVSILYGAREPKELLFESERKMWEGNESIDYKITVDRAGKEDRWKGRTGVITTLIPDLALNPSSTYAVVCGPPIMYRFVIKSLKEKGFSDDHILLSLERRMKCGVGKCGHCQIGQYYACKDGPVFFYSEIKDIKEAI